MEQNENLKTLLKIVIFWIFLPISVIWYVWKKTTWSKTKKWLATIAVVLVVLIFLPSNFDKAQNEKNKEIEALNARVALLENKLAQEKQNSIPASVESVSPVAEAPENVDQNKLYDVLSITDGDTIKVSVDGKIESLRLIGIDTPETVDPTKPVQCFGKESSDKAREILSNKKVRLEADATSGDRDQYQRLLRYVILSDGTFYNKKMIEDGFAHEYTFKNEAYKYQTEFKDAEKSAKNSKLGFWSAETCNGDTTKDASSVSTVSASASVSSAVSETQTPAISTSSSSGGVVKKSSTGICHAPATTYYEKTKSYTAYNSLQECLNSGGRMPKG